MLHVSSLYMFVSFAEQANKYLQVPVRILQLVTLVDVNLSTDACI